MSYRALILSLVLLNMLSAAGGSERKFSLKDDIELIHFKQVVTSPDGERVLVQTERGSLEDGLLHDTFRVYSVAAIRAQIRRSRGRLDLVPFWQFELAFRDTHSNTERISGLRWATEGRGFAFLWQTDSGFRELRYADLERRTICTITPTDVDVLGFDIRDRRHYAYSVASFGGQARLADELAGPARVGTGRSFEDLVFPEESAQSIQRGELWAVNGGTSHPVLDQKTGRAVVLYGLGNESLSLSPAGGQVAVLEAVPDVTEDWVKRYQPPFSQSADRLAARMQDLSAAYDSWSYVSEWVLIRLNDGAKSRLTEAPEALRAGWWESHILHASWSRDGSRLLLPGTFSQRIVVPDGRPCFISVSVESLKSECVRPLKRRLSDGFEPGWVPIIGMRYLDRRQDKIEFEEDSGDQTNGPRKVVYQRQSDGEWLPATQAGEYGNGDVKLRVRESFDDPPRLTVSDSSVGTQEIVLLDPNRELRTIERGKPELYSWQDSAGRPWKGILYKPVGYRPDVRYPLVLQTHGFSVDQFVPSGSFASAFAAEELASAGMMVLQVRDCAERSTPTEAACNVEGYEGAIEALSQAGLIDRSRVGIIGFSRTVYYVLTALTSKQLHFRAASITDGITGGYMNYLLGVGMPGIFNEDTEEIMGGAPYKAGLRRWLESSPVFHLDRVDCPVRIVATARMGTAALWEPYALLQSMGKPVELIVLNTREHVNDDPIQRKITQGGNVDWFRFWLQGYKDDDPAKADQYVRWKSLAARNRVE